MTKRRSNSPNAVRRDIPNIATPRVSDRRSSPVIVPRVALPRRPPFIVPGADKRRYVPPTAQRSFYKTISGGPARVVAPPLKKPLPGRSRPAVSRQPSAISVFQAVPAQLLFAEPKKALDCVRRSVRRQVLAATRKLGANRYRKPTNPVRC